MRTDYLRLQIAAQARSVTRRKSFSKIFQEALKFLECLPLRVGIPSNGSKKIFSENPQVPANAAVKEWEDAVGA
jgi:hypothetical protein